MELDYRCLFSPSPLRILLPCLEALKIWPQISLDADRQISRKAHGYREAASGSRSRPHTWFLLPVGALVLFDILATISADLSVRVATTRIASLSLLLSGPVGQGRTFYLSPFLHLASVVAVTR